VFPRQFQLLRESYFEQQKKVIRKTVEDLLVFLTEGRAPAGVDEESQRRVERTLATLKQRYRYCDRCAREACSQLLKKRYA